MIDLKRRMDGRRILVIGAGGGIGRACVERLLAEGAVVAAADLGTGWQDRPEVFEMPVDVTDEESVDRFFEQVKVRLGGLDGFLYSSCLLYTSGGLRGAGQKLWAGQRVVADRVCVRTGKKIRVPHPYAVGRLHEPQRGMSVSYTHLS